MTSELTEPQGADSGMLSRVSAWLSNEGYPLEFAVAEEFESHGFRVFQGFYTEAEGVHPPREIDVLAEITRHAEDSLIRAGFVVECKVSKKKPWVLFTGGGGISSAACAAQSIGSELGEVLLWKEAGHPFVQEAEQFSSGPQTAFGGRQAFSDKRDVLFDAMRKVVGDSVSTAKRHDSRNETHLKAGRLPESALIVFPMIVVDGALIQARKGAGQTLDVAEVQTARLHWRGAGQHRFAHATIDIVQADYLGSFLDKRTGEVRAVLNLMSDALSEVKGLVARGELSDLSVSRAARGMVGMPPMLRRLMEHSDQTSSSSEDGASKELRPES